MVAGEETDTHRQIRTIPHSKNIMATTEEVVGEGCHLAGAAEEDLCRDHRQPIQLGADTIQEVVAQVEDTPRMVVLLGEEGALRR